MRSTITKTILVFLLGLILLFTGYYYIFYNKPTLPKGIYQIEEGFKLEIIASEPLIEAPVAMDFDDEGRMWVVEMKGYMQNLEDSGAELPNGTITILEDLDNDGIADHSKKFIDSLVLPRAIALVYGGLLYAEPPNLWFVNIKNDKPTHKILVDSLYSDGGSVEHQPNGLMMHIDNWIYNAKSNFRYQMKNEKWVKEPTSFRGQWGITKDNFGRLYYNNNSTQLIGDYVLPNTAIKNHYSKPNSVLNKTLTPDQRVYPLHPTSVNRGDQRWVLDWDGFLVNVTSACGPMIYRGDQFPEAYYENAFVCAPEANLVKRNILTYKDNKVTAQQAIPKKEFIASTDEGFRPVNLYNGPDGNMYVVDMHRGIIQDKAFLTPYLQKEYADKKLDTIIGMGRILKVSSQNSTLKESISIGKLDTEALVGLLKSTNGWLRDRAQQLLILKNSDAAIPLLKEMTMNITDPMSQIHAMHTLNGIDALDYELLENILSSNSKKNVISHALVLLEDFASLNHLDPAHKLIEDLLQKNNKEVDLYIAITLGEWVKLSPEKSFHILLKLSHRYKNDKAYQEAIINSLRGTENEFLVFLNQIEDTSSETILSTLLSKTIENKSKDLKNSIYTKTSAGTDSRAAGYKMYRNICAACHGIDGAGIDGLAPPLIESEYVKGSTERLALIILHGLSGPVHVNGKLYDMNGVMPGLANNSDITDKDVQDIISYLNNAFSNKYEDISLEKIKSLRAIKPKKNNTFSEKELLKLNY